MFEIYLKKLSVAVDFSFFAAVSLLILLKDSDYALYGLAACIWHELGHLTAMRFCNIGVKRVFFYGAGIKIVPDKQFAFTDFLRELVILLAGSGANFILAAALFLGNNMELTPFAAVNTAIGLFNLLPLQYLDGGKLAVLLIRRFCGIDRAGSAEWYLKWGGVVLIAVILAAAIIFKKGNLTLYAVLGCLLISAFS